MSLASSTRLWLRVLCLLYGGFASIALGATFEERRAALLDLLIQPEVRDLEGSSYRGHWQYYQASLFEGTNVEEANDYFANSPEVVSGEWNSLLYVRTYHQFAETRLTAAARERLRGILEGFQRLRPNRGENHPIVTSTTYLLTDQALGRERDQHEQARSIAVRWIVEHVRTGFSETNSPHYLERSLISLLNLYDFTDDPELKLLARISLDQMMAEFALTSLDGVRGGPWHRVVRLNEITDGWRDGLHVEPISSSIPTLCRPMTCRTRS